MSRTKIILAMGGVAVVAGAVGCALGMLSAPASGKELRRRVAWCAGEEWRSASRASRDFVRRAFQGAMAELERRRTRVGQTTR